MEARETKFTTDFETIFTKMSSVDPIRYGYSRNFIDGSVSHLSPYISRGVISTKVVLSNLLERFDNPKKIEKFIQELTWRDYWQKIWLHKGDQIDHPNGYPSLTEGNAIPTAFIQINTGITALDTAIKGLYDTGYMHNHLRMYIAAVGCNIGKYNWGGLAQWMYYHLLDGDWASNALSWQWVKGINRGKNYIANQENINKYCYTKDRGTYLDRTYEELAQINVPTELKQSETLLLKTELPATTISLDPKLPTYIYTSYNLDPNWGTAAPANRILLLEPSLFEKYPISKNVLDFIISLGQNIPNLKIHTSEFSVFITEFSPVDIHYKEHPLNRHFYGKEHQRDWMFNTEGPPKSFFNYWKKCKKELGL